MKLVCMKHPELETAIRVQDSAVPIHEQSGWVVVPDEEIVKISASEFIDRYGYDPEVVAEKNS